MNLHDFSGKHFLLVVENNSIPFDKRVWREATALRDMGARVSIICPSEEKQRAREVVDGIEVFRYGPRYSRGTKIGYLVEYLTAFLKIFFLFHKVWFLKGKFKVLHVANPPDIFWPVALYCRLFRIHFIFDEHDLTPETLLSRFGIPEDKPGFMYRGLRIFQYLSYRYADAVISTNETYRSKAIDRYPGNSAKTFVVRNGPDTREFHYVTPDDSLKAGKKFVFAYIGIMALQDGVEYIIRSLDYLVKERGFSDFITYLIGSGSDVERLKKLTEDLHLNILVKFTGRIPDDRAMEILSTADVCLSPDPYNPLNDSSTMNKVMEFMALGKPVVSFDLKEARYSAQDAALYVRNNDSRAFGDGILRLIHDRKKAKEMGDYGMRRVSESLCWQKQIENLAYVYERVLSGT